MVDGTHILIVESRYYDDVAEALMDGVLAELGSAGASFDRIEATGAFEIPAAISFAARAMETHPDATRYDGFIALGCVIRGETSHYDLVCQESARALQDLAVNNSLAIGYGIMTVDNHGQALVRARRDDKDRGGHAARACLGMIGLKRRFKI
jgi:6,7-dimethyl-8-ribityllumazine synthase